MAKARSDTPLLPSVLDRLIDEAPEASRDPIRSDGQALKLIVQSVRRDLESLLNSRRRFKSWPDEFKELRQSSVGYGLPDVTGKDLSSSQGREEFRRTVEQVIRTYEPRFQTVHVQMLSNAEEIDRTLRFRVDAVLRAEPVPIEVVFDSQLEPSTGSFDVKGHAL
jgi:type VI secretion system protein ImpF